MDNKKQEFIKLYGGSPDDIRTFWAPGRVNLIGEHTDYNGGFVFPAALTVGATLLLRKRDDGVLRLKTSDLPQIVEADVTKLGEYKHLKWGNYQLGVLHCLAQKGIHITGADMFYHDTVPHGGGLSSSAANEVVTAFAFMTLAGVDIDLMEVAKISQMAENTYCGVNCGIMDQFASAFGKKNHALFLDCKDLSHEEVPFQMDGLKLIITNTNKKHSLGASAYNERRSQCEQALAILKKNLDVTCLGEVSEEQFEQYKDTIADDVVRSRAAHIVSECARVKKSVESLKNGDIKAFGQFMNQSHKSLQYDYQVTCHELDVLAQLAWEQEGVLGSRMTGAGFGGCTVSIVEESLAKQFVEHVGNEYREQVGYDATFYISEIGDGVKEILEVCGA